GLDIIVNNAGFTWDNVIQKMSDEQWQALLDVHLTAPFRILRAAQPVIKEFVKREQAAGQVVTRKVINISSVSGLYGSVGQAGYSTAKAGVIGLTKTLAREWGRLQVTVNCVAFGLIDTRMAVDVAAGTEVNIGGRSIRYGVNSELLSIIEQRIPLGRKGTPEDAAGAVYLFAIPESDYVSGEVLLCGGGLAGL
ncbi:MAG: SDR family oxidoreductase, partial [Gemmatimonadetes bacterium]|nr:SDR family oxidoreductase [Gemmatimonadota bacterium]